RRWQRPGEQCELRAGVSQQLARPPRHRWGRGPDPDVYRRIRLVPGRRRRPDQHGTGNRSASPGRYEALAWREGRRLVQPPRIRHARRGRQQRMARAGHRRGVRPAVEGERRERMTILDETYTLSNDVTIPKLGLGTWFIDDDE